jgi:diguanylate cyclase (GGDEF)-like protein
MLSLLAANLQAMQSDPAYRILYINSYHRGFSWSDDIERGMRKELGQSNLNYELSTEYLDSKRFDYKKIEDSLFNTIQKRYENYQPDIILVSDNNAFNFVTSNRDRLFPDIPIVFSGYNNFTADVIEGIDDITGINEKIDLRALSEMAIAVHPNTKALAFIVSNKTVTNQKNYESSIATFDQLRKHYHVEVLLNKKQDEIAKTLALMPEDSLVFLAGRTANKGLDRKLSSYEQGKLVVDVSPFPMYTFWNFHLDSGATGGYILSGLVQGENMARIALQIADGTQASSIPVMMSTPAEKVFNYDKLQTFNVDNSLLPSKAIVLNEPKALWDEYKYHFLIVIILLVIQMVLILVLLINIRKRQQALQSLDIERSSLEFRVLERTNELKLANLKLERLSLEDGLTNLKNRRFLDNTIEKEVAALKRTKEPLSIIMIDIDYFKQYNDIYGHIEGDNCLKAVSASLNTAISRPRDVAARYGGEEFVIVLPDTHEHGANQVVSSIFRHISDLNIEHGESPFNQKVTISAGMITVLPSDQLSLDDSSLLVLVDKLLYNSKDNGRNQVTRSVYEEVFDRSETEGRIENVTHIDTKRIQGGSKKLV